MSSAAVAAQLSPGFSCNMVDIASTCGDDCQYCQMLALIDSFWSLNGPAWHNNTGWPADGTPEGYVPLAHCSWHGIYCCGADGSLIADRDTGSRSFVVTGQTACKVPLGVAAILLASNNLNGTLDDQLLISSPLRVSLDILTLNSAPYIKSSDAPGSPLCQIYWAHVDTLLADNSLYGDLPESSVGAPYLHYLNLDGNRFSGTVPQGLFLSPALDYVSTVSSLVSSLKGRLMIQ